MRALLIALSLLEVLLVAGVLVGYLVLIIASLLRTVGALRRVSFGVRAIETQCSGVGPAVVAINERLSTLVDAFGALAGAAQTAGGRRRRG